MANKESSECPSVVPPTGTAEKFIGMGGGATHIFLIEEDGTEVSSFKLIKQLGLRLGDPEVSAVARTFSRLTRVAEIRAFGGIPDFPVPEADQEMVVPAEATQKINEVLWKKIEPRVVIHAGQFTGVFADQLRAQGLEKLADRIDPPPVEGKVTP